MLDADGEADRQVVEPVLVPVDDGPVGEERGEAAPARGDDRVGAPHPEVRLLLPREARVRQVLGGRARADGDARIRPGFPREGVVGLADLALEARRPGCLEDELSDGGRGSGQHGHVLAGDVLEDRRHAGP